MNFGLLAPVIQHTLDLYGHDCHTLATLSEGVDAGLIQYWPTDQSFLFTELKQAPSGKRSIHFFMAGGKLDELKYKYRLILDWAKTQGCTSATMVGRPGWMRSFLVAEDQWIPSLVYYSKDL